MPSYGSSWKGSPGRAVAGAEDPSSVHVPNLWGLHGLEMSPLSELGETGYQIHTLSRAGEQTEWVRLWWQKMQLAHPTGSSQLSPRRPGPAGTGLPGAGDTKMHSQGHRTCSQVPGSCPTRADILVHLPTLEMLAMPSHRLVSEGGWFPQGVLPAPLPVQKPYTHSQSLWDLSL